MPFASIEDAHGNYGEQPADDSDSELLAVIDNAISVSANVPGTEPYIRRALAAAREGDKQAAGKHLQLLMRTLKKRRKGAR